MKILCTICMRGGSKTIKNKNFKKINGVPLMFFTINQAIKSNLFDIVMVSTDSKKIYNYAKQYGAEAWFLRPKKLSTDSSPQLLAIKHALLESEKKFDTKFDIVFNLHATAPLRDLKDIKKALKLFLYEKKNQLISVTESYRSPYFNMIEKKNKKIYLVKRINKNIFKKQKTPKVFDLNASIYIWKRNFLLKSKQIINPNTSLYIMPKERSVDIDTNFDWKVASYLMSNKLIKK